MKIQIVLTIFLLSVPGLVYGAAEPMQTDPQQPFDLEHLPDPAFASLAQSLPYETLISLRSTSRTFRNKLRDPKFADLLPTKLIEYWSQPLVYVSTAKSRKHYPQIAEIQFSPNGQYMATSSLHGKFFLWQLQEPAFMKIKEIIYKEKKCKKIRGWKETKIKYDIFSFSRFTPFVDSCIAFSSDGTIIAGTYLNKIFFWDVMTGKLKDKIAEKNVNIDIDDIAFARDGKSLIYHFYPFVKLINLKTHQIIQEIKAENAYFFTFSHAKSLLAFQIDKQTMGLWRVEDNTMKEIGEFKHSYEISSAVFSPDGTTLAIGLENGDINLWNVKIGEKGELSDVDKPINVLSHIGGLARFLVFSRYGAILASASYSNNNHEYDKIRLWNMKTGQQITAVDGHGPIALSPDGLLLAVIDRSGHMGLWQQAELAP